MLQYFDMKDNFTKSKSLQIVVCRSSVHFSLQKNMIFIIKAKRNRQNLYIKWIIRIFVAYPFWYFGCIGFKFPSNFILHLKMWFSPFHVFTICSPYLVYEQGKKNNNLHYRWWAINKKIQPQRSCLA